MPFENPIWRIDDRLIHGQVIIGWCGELGIRQLIVLDDEIATTEWEKNLMQMAAPPDLPTRILQVDEILPVIEQITDSKDLNMILFKSPTTIQQLSNLGISIKFVNVGGIHFRENRVELLSYLYLSPDEVQIFKDLMAQGIQFKCQDLPNAPAYDLDKVLEKKRQWK